MIKSPNTPSGREVGAVHGNTPAERAAATTTVLHAARDRRDAHLLLDALGLLPTTTRPNKREPKHGTPYRYRTGCRCDDCRRAQSARCKARREASKQDPSRADRAGHGKAATYNNHGCRCDACKEAHAARLGPYLAARRAAVKQATA